MTRSASLALGIIFTVVASMFGLVLLPERQLGGMGPVTLARPDGTEAVYPQPLDAWREAPGREVYRSLGCVYCHSQQVRPEGFGADLARGWGRRRSVPRDYLYQDPPLAGTMRTGPDLASIGSRQPSAQWHYLHLYDPQITSQGSIMPPYRFLFDTTHHRPPATFDAVKLPDDYSDAPTWLLPNADARALVAYLLALEQPYALEAVR